MFEKYYGKVKEMLVGRDTYRPFPTIDEREPWENLAQEQKDLYLELAERYVGYDWPSIPATRYLDYYRNGNRSRYTNMEYQRRAALMTLVLAECIENKGRFVDDIVNGFWVILDEASWVGPAHNGFYPPAVRCLRPLPPTTRQEDIWVDHFAGDTGCMMAVLAYFVKDRLDQVSPQIYERIVHELNRRIIKPFMDHDDLPWMGTCPGETTFVNNWTPWVVSNCLATVAVISDDPELRAATLEKALRMADLYLDTIYPDGGCEEGTRYWGVAATAVFALLEMFFGLTNGKIDEYGQEKLHNYTNFIVGNHIDEHRFTTYSDSDRNVHVNLQSAWYFAEKVNNPLLQQMALYLRPACYKDRINPVSMHGHAYFTLRELFTYKEYAAQPPVEPPYLQDAWFEGIQLMTARAEAGSPKGLFFSATACHNDVSHNHNDVGTYIISSDGKPCIIDMGAGDYTASSFGKDRYILNPCTNSAHHNLPLVNGVEQREGREFTATDVVYENTGDVVKFGMNIEKAYPADGPIASWRRDFTFDRTTVTLNETFALKEATDDIQLLMITNEKPTWENNTLRVPAEDGRAVLVNATEGWTPEVTEWDVSNNGNFTKDWGGMVYRIIWRPAAAMKEGAVTMTFKQE